MLTVRVPGATSTLALGDAHWGSFGWEATTVNR